MTLDEADGAPAGAATPLPFCAAVGPSSVLHVGGTLDCESAAALRAALHSMTTSNGCISVDLADVTFMDSSGVQVLVDAAQLIAEIGPMVLLRASPAARRTLELCGAGRFFDHRSA